MNLVNNLICFPKKQLFGSLAIADNVGAIFFRRSDFLRNGFKINNSVSQICRISESKFSTSRSLSSPPKTAFLSFVRNNVRTFYESSGADINTNVSKDVVIFEYNHDRFFLMMKIFGLTQILVWGYLAETSYSCLKDTPVEELPHRELKWWETINLGENWVRNGITTLCLCMGFGLSYFAYLLSIRSVKKVILHRGGRDITIQTYAFFGKKQMKVPLKMVSCEISQASKPKQLPLKVKGKMLYYTLDGQGTFPHPTLFEWTAGLKRKL